MAASPEFFQPSAAPAYTPRLLFVTAAAAADDDQEDDRCCCRTPTGAGISYLAAPATCPPAPRKPRPPPTSACRKRLFAAGADIIALNFDDLEAVFRPASLSGGKQQRRPRSTGNLGGRASRAVRPVPS